MAPTLGRYRLETSDSHDQHFKPLGWKYFFYTSKEVPCWLVVEFLDMQNSFNKTSLENQKVAILRVYLASTTRHIL